MKNIQLFLQKPWIYILILLVGISLKFYRIDNNFFWFDEMCTILHITGNEQWDIPMNQVVDVNTHIIDSLHLSNRDLTIKEEFHRISNLTNLNPLHYYLLSFWYRIAGDDPMNYRYFSLIMFILTLPVLFLLARSLFGTNLSGWIAISLFSASPFFQHFAQEARFYMLWSFILFGLHYLFLQAVEKNRIKWWIGYLVVGILSLYASILSGLILIGHFIYLMITNRKLWLKFVASSVLMLLAYLPRMISITSRWQEISFALAWQTESQHANIFSLVWAHILYLASSIVDASGFRLLTEPGSHSELQGVFLKSVLSLLIVFLFIYAIVYAFKKLPRNKFLFLIFLVLPQILFFIFVDLVRGSTSSLVIRYHLITIQGGILFLIFLLSNKIQSGKLLYSGLFIGIILFGFISIYHASQERSWDNTYNCNETVSTAKIISESQKPLLILCATAEAPENVNSLTLLYECEYNKLDFIMVYPPVENIQELISKGDYTDIYVRHNSDPVIGYLKSQFGERMDSLEIEGILPMWKIRLN